MAMFHTDTVNYLQTHTGWSKGPNLKQIFNKKDPFLPSRCRCGQVVSKSSRVHRRSLSSNDKHKASNKSIEEGFMLRGALLSPRPESDDKLEKSRVDMQSFSNDIISNQAISDIFQAVIAAPHPMPLDFYRDMCVKIQAIAEENTRTMEPYLVPFIHDYAYIKREVCNAMVNGLQPKRVLDTLLQAPIFSSDTNAFPIDTIKLISWPQQ